MKSFMEWLCVMSVAAGAVSSAGCFADSETFAEAVSRSRDCDDDEQCTIVMPDSDCLCPVAVNMQHAADIEDLAAEVRCDGFIANCRRPTAAFCGETGCEPVQ